PFTADVLTGATVTSNAVIEALTSLFPAEEAAAEEASTAEELTATAKGFQSDVTVKVTLNEDGTIATLVSESAGETQGFGTRCGEDEAFAAQFIGQKAPFTADVLTGATVTSNAVIEALTSLFHPEEAAVETPAAEELTATAKGYQSDVTVKVTLNEDGTIATLTIESAGETQGLGTRCGEDEAFAAQFIGKAAPFTAGEGVDVLSGATVTSNAVMEALNSAVQSK
ncbi:MAG: FMN-binding protein, partial [Clostridia bacterium]|nr:FMN-binding protein [Clostridia bacterium]